MGAAQQTATVNLRAVVCAVLAAATLVACGQAPETPSAGPAGRSSGTGSQPGGKQPPSTTTFSPSSSSPSTTSGASDNGALVAYAFEEDLWLYDGRSGRVERLTSDGYERRDHSPGFRHPGLLTFVSMSANKDDSTLVEVDLITGTRRTVLHVDDALWAYDWSAGGASVVYVVRVAGDEPDTGGFDHEVRLVRSDGTVGVLRRFDGLSGRGTFVNYDDVHVDWSPDGSKLLLVDTHLDGVETLFVLDPDGTDLVPPRPGTWGRWAGDSRTVASVDEPTGEVRLLDITTGAAVTLPSTGPARRIAVSPDGRLLAYDDGAEDPTVFVYDLERRTRRSLARHAVGALWLSPGELAAGHATPCVPTDRVECGAGGHGPRWTETGDGWSIDVTTGKTAPLAVASTIDAATGQPPR